MLGRIYTSAGVKGLINYLTAYKLLYYHIRVSEKDFRLEDPESYTSCW